MKLENSFEVQGHGILYSFENSTNLSENIAFIYSWYLFNLLTENTFS